MPQVEKKDTGGGGVGSRNVGESIEIERQQQGGRAAGDCVGGPVETFVAASGSASTSCASSSSRSGSSSVSPQPPLPPPPLTLIDANVASSAGKQQRRPQGSVPPASLSPPPPPDKSHQDLPETRRQQQQHLEERRATSEQVGAASRASAKALDKLSGLDKQQQQQQQQRQSQQASSRYHKASGQVERAAQDSQRLAELRAEAEAAAVAVAEKRTEKDEDELNNNSIHLVRAGDKRQQQEAQVVAHRLHQQQRRELGGQSVKSPAASLSHSIRQSAQQTKELSPLSLLTGLRMHTNNLRSQQQQQQQQQQGESNQPSRKPQTSGESELQTQQRVPLTVSSGASRLVASPAATTASPAPFVESSFNPDDEEEAAQARQPGGYVPGYTSIFSNKPTLPPSSDNQQQQQQQQVSSITTTSRLSESTSRLVTNRSPLKKQAAQFDLSSTSVNSHRNLFAAPPPPPPPSASSKQEINTTRRLPLLLRAADYSRRPLNAGTFDCGDNLDAGNSARRGRRLESSEDDNEDQDMNDLELDDADDLEAEEEEEEEELDEKSPFSGRSPQSHLNQIAGRSSRPGLGNSRDSVRRASDNQQQQPHNKYPGSAKLSRHLGTQKLPAGSAQSHRGAMSVKKQQMAAQAATAPQAQHTKISIGELSRPPSFNTTTNQCQNQQKVASCRKLDLLEQVAHLECSCHICSKNRKLASLHDNLYHHTHLSSNGKLSQFDFSNSSSAKLHKIDKGYPKTHFMHLVLKSIILVLCMLLLLLVLVGSIMLSISLPHSMDKVVNATRSFNVTIAGR